MITGREFEELVFGPRIKVHKNFDIKKTRKISFAKSLAIVKESQHQIRWNPSNPHTDLGKRLFGAVRDTLPRDWMQKKLRLYVSVGMELDVHYGSDAVFMIDEAFTLIDLSLREKIEPLYQFMHVSVLLGPKDFEPPKLQTTAEVIALDLMKKWFRRKWKTEKVSD